MRHHNHPPAGSLATIAVLISIISGLIYIATQFRGCKQHPKPLIHRRK